MEIYYTTGQFAKKAGTTERTIRYYDSIGVLKPTKILSNGYRQYSENDFFKLQRIITLQHLGFTLEEIYPMLLEENSQEGFRESIGMQINIVKKKISYLNNLKDSLTQIQKLMYQGSLEWERITDLIKLTNDENMIVEEYRGASNLLMKIKLHHSYSINPQGWFDWIFEKIDFIGINRLLEIGCGNGELWIDRLVNTRHREFFLTDINDMMLEKARENIGDIFNYMVMDGENITFKKEYFDTVVANHVIFYFTDIKKGLKEIIRVLKADGKMYCTTYGKRHMQEIQAIVKEFDPKISLVETNLYEHFGIENGEEILPKYFREVQFRKYDDCLKITDSKILIEYILSCPGNQNEIIGKSIVEFRKFINMKIKKLGYILITKEVGLFICKK